MATPDELASAAAAAELALGLLEGDERAAALRRQLAEPQFAREVEQWRERFALLFESVPAEAPPHELAERIEARLGPTSDRDRAPRAVASPGFWRPLALTSSLAAAALAGVMVLRPPPQSVVVQPPAAPGAQMVAALAPAGKGAPLAAFYDPGAHVVRMPAMPVPAGRSAQLWAIVDGRPPIPLGLFRVVGSGVVAEAQGSAAMHAGTTLAISFEPVGGSRTGQPTGPVVASGILSKV